MVNNWLYPYLRALVRFWVKFFFKELSILDADLIPNQGPLLIVLNHPNNLLDSVLIASVFPRKIHFLATGQLFKNSILASILTASGVIPVYRKQDGGDEEKNKQTFAKVTEILQKGGVVAIYPEGITHSDHFLHKIKTGAARMALEAETHSNFQLGLKIMPIGINFLSRKSFQRCVTINFGQPVQPFTKPISKSEERNAIIDLTNKLQEALEGKLLNIEQVEIQPIVQDLEEIYKTYLTEKLHREGHKERAEAFTLSQQIIDAVEFYQHYLPEKFNELYISIKNYKRKRDYLELPESAFRQEFKEGFSTNGYTLILIEVIIGLPFFLYAVIQHLLPYFLPRLISHFGARKETDYATIRFLASIITFPLFYSLQTGFVISQTGYLIGLFYLISIPLTGAYAIRYFNGLQYFRNRIHLLYLFMNQKGRLKRLVQERELLIRQLDKAREVFLEHKN
ncbi:MAG: 1-acyl-sn-glycerol-3-phosphate acyltransferase [Acidobacteria bacterium]|nr:1-acyl-sn-glycerol-3-phosphate acyltransferase [Acidobacteriota bacterium]